MFINFVRSSKNEDFRNNYVINLIKKNSEEFGNGQVIFDIGAGLSPYKQACVENGWKYYSHDFGKYNPNSENHPGLQSDTWDYPQHDFICDILDIPLNKFSDLVICTEVFEHIPNPIAALNKLSNISKDNGLVLVTVPFASLMHQAPYWFQSGLSPYWFEYWAKIAGIEILEMIVYGDYIDVLSQEITRVLPSIPHKILSAFTVILRKFVKKDVLQSLGFGVIFLGKVSNKF
jgi:hypothetical protein